MPDVRSLSDPGRRHCLAVAASLGLLVSAPVRAQPRPERARVTLALGGKNTLYYLPVLLAAQLNYFSEEGVAVELQDHAGGGLAEQALISGHADVAAGAYQHTILLRQRGLNCRAFALLGRAPQTVFGVSNQALADGRALSTLRGQRVGISAPDSEDHLIKRIIGVAGDHVVCCNQLGQVEVNGTPIDETPYLDLAEGQSAPQVVPYDVTVPQGSLWVLGDNRDHSRDSRYNMDQPSHGFVPLANVVGRAFLITWPLSRFGPIDTHHAVFEGVPEADG